MGSEQSVIEPAMLPTSGSPKPTPLAETVSLPARATSPGAPLVIADSLPAHATTVPLRPAQRGLSLLCALLRALRQE